MANLEQAGVIKAQRHPKRYESHKYWGRKPANIVRDYIARYTKPGDRVLDPFCGSGVTLFEASALDRNAVGYDLNPIACFIAENLMAKDVDILALEGMGEAIIKRVEERYPYYVVGCGCGEMGALINAVWRDGRYIAKYYVCPHCGHQMAGTTPFDRQLLEQISLPTDLWYPKDALPPNADAKYVHELFSKRNLLALGLLLREIRGVQDKTIRNLLLYTFTSNVAFTSRLIPVNKKRFRQGRNCSGIWGFKRFWLPNFHVENNVFRYFRNRLKRTIAAKTETNRLLAQTQAGAQVINRSATGMPELAERSVDFIFTDPPFGNMIPYLNLSTLWNAWLQFEVNDEDEIIIDQARDEGDYYRKMLAVFEECQRVLKADGFLVVAFNNKNIRVWRLLLEAIRRANFRLRECLPAQDGEVSFTQTTTSAKGSSRGHFVYVFQKGEGTSLGGRSAVEIEGIIAQIEGELVDFMAEGPKSTTEIYNHLIPFMVNHNLLHEGLKDDTIERLLDKRCELVTRSQQRMIEGEVVDLKSYYWALKG
jgi:16S rRNA G966 N2-methylase RsmD